MFSLLAFLAMISDRITFVILPYFLLDKGISGLNFGLTFSLAAALVIISFILTIAFKIINA